MGNRDRKAPARATPDPRQSAKAQAPAAGTPLANEGTHTSPEGKSADDAKLPKRTPAAQALVSVTVPQPFNLTRDDGSRVRYEAGVQDMHRDDAEHWYAQAHGVEKNED